MLNTQYSIRSTQYAQNSALIIFVKNPVLGKVKTRLAKTIGNEKALKVYQDLLLHTRNVVTGLPVTKFVFFADEYEPEIFPIWTNCTDKFIIRQQTGDDLGERMHNAFNELFNEGFESIVIIGSDCPEINYDLLKSSFEVMNENDLVIGPASDGGYYLLGMKKLYPELFKDKVWSTNEVLKNTLQDSKNLNLTYKLLPVLNDVDEEKSLIHLKNLQLI